MIKRRFYRLEHGDRDDASASSSSESELDAEAMMSESDDDDDDSVEQVEDVAESCSTSSGHQSEDGSADEVAVDSPGVPDDEAGNETEDDQRLLTDSTLLDMHTTQSEEQQHSDKESIPVDLPEFILKCKSVFKCRLCPKIVCLSEETLTAHLKSKRHARSEKQMKEGRLKAMLNDDGAIENQGIPDETPEQDVAPPQDKPKQKKRGRRFLRQHKGKFRKKKREED